MIDCSDLDQSARFWAGVLGYVAGQADSPTYRSLIPGDGQGIEVLLQRTPDDKHQKNRLHLDLRTSSLEGGGRADPRPRRVPAHRPPRDRARMALAHPG